MTDLDSVIFCNMKYDDVIRSAEICAWDAAGSTIPYMTSRNRVSPRIPVESLCTEVVGEREQLALVIDLGESGLRLQRPLRGRGEGRIVQVEFELPETDELVWAKGEICFDRLRPGPTGPVRSTGVRVVAAAARHLRMLRDWAMASSERRQLDGGLLFASHWRG